MRTQAGSAAAETSSDLLAQVQGAIKTTASIILGKEDQIKLSIACLLAGGHLLIEDLPGMGKTTLSMTLAKILGLSHNRVQFTSDLLPADILGVSIFDRDSSQFSFQEGPIFAQLILADEINRATPKCQSALLEAMEERQVTVDGVTRLLPQPFFVIATQNPANQSGTFPLPESQLDRFLMRIELGYPDPKTERAILAGEDRRAVLADINSQLDPTELIKVQLAVKSIQTTDTLLDYVQRLIEFTRRSDQFSYGLSPRGGLGLLRAARAWAYLSGRTHVLPEDVQKVLPAVVEHRIRRSMDQVSDRSDSLTQSILTQVDVIA